MLCFATVDRYCSTSRDVRRRNWSSLKVAKISILIALMVSFSLPIPDFFYIGIKQEHCGYISIGYDKYFTYFMAPVLLAIFPVSILSIFGFLTRRNLRKCTATAQKTAAQRINHQLSLSNNHWKQLHVQQKKNGTLVLSLIVYCGQTKGGVDEVKKIRANIGDLISMNMFLSTTADSIVVSAYAYGADRNTSVLF
ncbi:unnamed protein product [Rotaria sp. Silwood1]|nr:unnamed protein product [Rotaria sp. Silwood1]